MIHLIVPYIHNIDLQSICKIENPSSKAVCDGFPIACTLDQLDQSMMGHCATGDVNTVQALIELGANVCCRDGAPLLLAAACNHINVITILLNSGKYETNRQAMLAASAIAKTMHHYKVSALLDACYTMYKEGSVFVDRVCPLVI
jgi:hypothetical protein